MKITTKEVRSVAEQLEWLIKVYKKENPPQKRDWRTYEERVAYRLKLAMRSFEPLIEKAVASIQVSNANAAGKKPDLTLKQKVTLLLIKHLAGKSNREMSAMLVLFSLLNDIDAGYKTVERLYSDELVILALHNLHTLILEEKGLKEADAGGDGTGYTLTIKKNYADEVQKHKDKVKESSKAKKMYKTKRKRTFIYSFMLMDIKTRMYIAYGMSFKSERKAYNTAMEMLQGTGIKLKSIRLDRYYSAQKYAKELEALSKDLVIYLIPKKNATVEGPWNWKEHSPEWWKTPCFTLKNISNATSPKAASQKTKDDSAGKSCKEKKKPLTQHNSAPSTGTTYSGLDNNNPILSHTRSDRLWDINRF